MQEPGSLWILFWKTSFLFGAQRTGFKEYEEFGTQFTSQVRS
jgi:hypothetical protein